MSFSRIFLFISIVLFGAIGVAAYAKRNKSVKTEKASVEPSQSQVIEIDLATLQPASTAKALPAQAEQVAVQKQAVASVVSEASQLQVLESQALEPPSLEPQSLDPQALPSDIPNYDRVDLLFQKNSPLPIVETVQYKSKVSWKKGRSAWLVDYAAHHKTHLHFIARSMNGKVDYVPRPASEGQQFNVLSSDVNFYFYLLVDLSRSKMLLYAVMPDAQERVLLKTYQVGLGRLDSSKASGSLTPTGKYSLGNRIAVYQPKMMGTFRGNRTEMITVFGTRWIPFEKELGICSEPAKGYGIHGTPWALNSEGRLVDNVDSLGKYQSDGCIRLSAQDVEELFAIVSTHQSVVEIVSDFSKVLLPGNDKMY